MNIRKVLTDNSFVFKKKYGQNFLIDENILNNIVDTAKIEKDDLIIEIGVGAGALTKKVAPLAKNVLGYEIDHSLKEPLKTILGDFHNVEIIFDDFLNRRIKDDINKYDFKRLIVVANLPYYVTTPIITKFIEEKIEVEKIIVMVQNEVADRFSAQVKTKNYNSLTIFLNYYFDIKKCFFVSRNVFYPKPNVDSAVIELKRKKVLEPLKNEDHFFKLVKDSFKQKRKMLKNNLASYDLNKIDEVLKKYSKSVNARAEEITIDEFIDISNSLN